MKKNRIILLTILALLLITGCNNKTENTTSATASGNSDTTVENSEDTKVVNCTREATAKDNIEASFNYQIYYKGDYITLLHATEKVTSVDSNNLDTYENAYKNIKKRYNGLKYYDTKITRDDTSVTNDTTINYEKIDTNKLLEIEGSEDNVIENGKVKLETWMKFAKKLGVTCDN